MNAQDPASTLDGTPLAALVVQAGRRPRGEALRVLRHGAWRRVSWSELAVDVKRSAEGWAVLGLGPGDGVVALGPLGVSFIVTLLAVQALGAHVRVADDASLVDALATAGFVLAYGTTEVDQVLMHRPAALRALVVENEFGAEPSAGLALTGWQRLLEWGSGGATLEASVIESVALRAPQPEGGIAALTPAQLGAAPHAFAAWPGVLADFPLHWLPGLRWLMGSWLSAGSTLHIAEPRGRAGADLARARPGLWVASAATLAAFDADARSRIPARGPGAHAAHAALAEGRGLLQVVWRRRLRQVLGLAGVDAVLTEPHAPESAIALLQRLGMTVDVDLPQPRAVEASRPRQAAHAHARAERLGPAMDGVAP
jgi:hypothetical protein